MPASEFAALCLRGMGGFFRGGGLPSNIELAESPPN